MATSDDAPDDSLHSCATCKDTFDRKITKMLPCLHMICESCLESCLNNCLVDTGPVCPVCNRAFLQNSVLENVLVKRTRRPSDDVQIYICTSCEDNQPASCYCGVCQEYLCGKCSSAHRRVRMTKDHAICSIEEALQSNYQAKSGTSSPIFYCNAHSREKLTLFCETCDRITCRDCQLLDHKDHRFKFVADALPGQKALLEGYAAKMKEKLQSLQESKAEVESRDQAIRKRKDEIDTLTTEASVEIMTHVVEWCKRLMGHVRDICQPRIDRLDERRRDIVAKTERTKYCLSFLENTIDNDDASSVLYVRSALISNLEDLMVEKESILDEADNCNMLYQNNVKFLVDNVDKMGQIEIDGQWLPESTSRKSSEQKDIPKPPPLVPMQFPQEDTKCDIANASSCPGTINFAIATDNKMSETRPSESPTTNKRKREVSDESNVKTRKRRSQGKIKDPAPMGQQHLIPQRRPPPMRRPPYPHMIDNQHPGSVVKPNHVTGLQPKGLDSQKLDSSFDFTGTSQDYVDRKRSYDEAVHRLNSSQHFHSNVVPESSNMPLFHVGTAACLNAAQKNVQQIVPPQVVRLQKQHEQVVAYPVNSSGGKSFHPSRGVMQTHTQRAERFNPGMTRQEVLVQQQTVRVSEVFINPNVSTQSMVPQVSYPYAFQQFNLEPRAYTDKRTEWNVPLECRTSGVDYLRPSS